MVSCFFDNSFFFRILTSEIIQHSTKYWQHSEECMCRMRNIALENVTDGQTDGRTDRRTTDKVTPMCRYASEA